MGTLYRVVLGKVAFHYDNVSIQQQGTKVRCTYLQNKRAPFISITKLRSGFA